MTEQAAFAYRRPSLGRAALVVAGGILLSRLLGFLRNILLYGLLGRGEETDLYVDAFALPDYLYFLLAGGYLSITLVPILTDRLSRDDPRGANLDFTAVVKLMATGLALFTLVLLIFSDPLVRLVFSEVSDQDRLIGLVRIALVSQVFFGVGALFAAAQYSQRRFLIPTLAPLVYNLAIITGGLVGALAGEPSPEAFLWGGLFGAAIGNFGLQWWGSHRAGFRLLSRVGWRRPVVWEYLALALPLMIGQSVVALDEQWPRLFGQYVEEGATAGLHAARSLNMVPVGVIAVAAGVAAYPFLARLVSQQRFSEFSRTVRQSINFALVPAGLATVLLLTLSVPLVRMVYQWGNFEANDTKVVAPLLWAYALSIPFWTAHQIYTRAFYARRQMWLPVAIGSVLTAVTLLVLWWTAPTYGAIGIALTSAGSIVVYTIWIGWIWHRRHVGGNLGEAPIRVAMVSAITGLGVWLTTRIWSWLDQPADSPWLILIGGLVAFGLYGGGVMLMRLPLPWQATQITAEALEEGRVPVLPIR